MKKEHVLITSNFSSDTGFAWKFFYRLFNIIAREFHSKDKGICLSFAKVVQPVTVLDKAIPFHAFEFDPFNISFGGVLSLLRNIREHNIRYCYLTDFTSWHWLYPLMRLAGVWKIIVHTHASVADPYLPPFEKGLRKAIKTIIQNRRFLTADAIYACSEFSRNRLIRMACCPEKRIKVITHGIAIDRFECAKQNGGGRGNNVVRIVAIARATREKGIQVLIDAARIITHRHGITNALFEYGGDGPDLGILKDQVKRLELERHFTFLGVLDDTSDTICRADIVVVPSIWGDAYPLSVIEGMAAGKPVVATNVGGIPEEIGVDQCGILVRPNDAEELARRLIELIDDKNMRAEIGRNARMRAEQIFTESRFHNEVVRSILHDCEMA